MSAACTRGHKIEGLNAYETSGAPRCRACRVAHRRIILPGPDFEARFQAAADEAYTAYQAGYDSLTEYRRDSLLEDLDWLIRTGEISDNAARRLGYNRDGLYSYLNRIRRMDLWQQLTANDPKVAA